MTDPLILGIETSGPRTAVAIARDAGLVAEIARAGTGHDEILLELIAELLAEAGRRLDDLAAIGVSAGPGMFTGLRVGLATALGLALPRGLPLKAVSTLAALAGSTLPARRALALIDARRGQVYCGLYDSGTPLIAPRLADPVEIPVLVGPLLAGRTALAGSGVELCRPALALAGLDLDDSGIRQPTAFAVAVLARAGLEREGPDRPENVVPRYLRRTDAEINREKQVGRGGAAGNEAAGQRPAANDTNDGGGV